MPTRKGSLCLCAATAALLLSTRAAADEGHPRDVAAVTAAVAALWLVDPNDYLRPLVFDPRDARWKKEPSRRDDDWNPWSRLIVRP